MTEERFFDVRVFERADPGHAPDAATQPGTATSGAPVIAASTNTTGVMLVEQSRQTTGKPNQGRLLTKTRKILYFR
jgi:hypothetical protein